METRSRKRALATSNSTSGTTTPTTATRSTKRSRLSSSSNVAVSSLPTPSRATSSSNMNTNPPEPSASTSASATRGGNNPNPNSNPNANPNTDNSLDKGKEIETETNVRVSDMDIDNRDTDRYNEDDDSDSEDVRTLNQNITSATNALQGLLRKIGSGLDELMPPSAKKAASGSSSSSSRNSQLKNILSDLRAYGEQGKQIEALSQLCNILAVGTEDTLSGFSVESFVPVLVGLMNYEINPDMMLLATRAITHLCDALPSSCMSAVDHGAIPCLVARLLTIEYMDLAEQSLQALKKISQEHPTACLRAGALMAVLSYLDFFSTGVQRVALSTAANMCKKLPSDAADFVMEAVPLLTNLLQYHDANVTENASVCLTRIVEAFAASPDKLDELCNYGLVTQAASLISISGSGGGQASLSPSTYTGLIRLLSTCARGSPLGSTTLLVLGISGILKDILSGSGLVATMSVSPALSRPPEQIFEIVNLTNELLPPLPHGTISLPASTHSLMKGHLSKKSSAGSSDKREETSGGALEISNREKLLTDQPEILQQFGMDLLPVLIQMYGSSVNAPVRHKCLSVIAKLTYFSSPDMIQCLFGATNISSFLAGVMAWKDPQVLLPSLQIAEILMEKLPETFSKLFVREGVVHAVDTLIVAEKDAESTSGSSSRSRHSGRHLDGTSNVDVPTEDPKSTTAVGSPATSVEGHAVNSSLQVAVSTRAKAFRDKYFPSVPGAAEVGFTDDLLHLKKLCSKLNSSTDANKLKSKGKSKACAQQFVEFSPIKEDNLLRVIAEIMAELSKGDGVSTFEFIGSGVVDTLLNYLSCGCYSEERVSEVNLPKLREQAIKRYKSFVEVALPYGFNDSNLAPMSVLVQKLQNALTTAERFATVLSHNFGSTGSGRASSGLGASFQPIKLRLCRADGEKTLLDYSTNIILIDPLASLTAVENFLWPRVQRSESSRKTSTSVQNPESGNLPVAGSAPTSSSTLASATCRQSTRSRSSINTGNSLEKETKPEKKASSSKGKGKAVLKPTQAEGRIASRRKAATDKDTSMKSVDNETTSEDEDVGISPVEIDDALVIEDDNISEDGDGDDRDDMLRDDALPVSLPDAHDEKVGDSSGRGTPSMGSESTECKGAMSFAAAAMSGLASANSRGIKGGGDRHGQPIPDSSGSPKLMFTSGGKQLSRNLTIFQAIHQHIALDEADDERTSDFISSDGSKWSDIYTLTYQKADSQDHMNMDSTSPKSSKAGSTLQSNTDTLEHQMSFFDSLLQGELPCDLEKTNPTYNILALLRLLEGLNQLAPCLRVQSVIDNFAEGKISCLNDLNVTGSRVSADEFINSKLTPKLSRQIQDVLALFSGSIPSWCYQLTKACPFLFPFETRRQYFYSTAFGLSRALYRLQQQQGADGNGSMNERELRVGRLRRQKVRVSRNRVLDSAAKVMEMYSSQKAVLEVEYFGEVGTGLGPTMEFYTLLSHDLQRADLKMWRSNSFDGSKAMEVESGEKKEGKTSDIIIAPLGLFPRPWPLAADTSDGSQFAKVIQYFRLLGSVMAKALQDGRLLDLALSTPFYKLVLGQELDLYDVASFDAELGKTLRELQALVCRKKFLELTPVHDHDEALDLKFRGASVEDLCLDFTLPGYPDFVLKSSNEDVNIDNLEDYISLVVSATVKTGIARQMEAFRFGFNQVFDISALQIFSPDELDYLLCGHKECWEADKLVEHIKFDHGYTSKSPAVVYLLEIMGEFSPEQQRAFCQFVTGAPRLPPGGLAVLNPKLTIVRKHSSKASSVTSNKNGLLDPADDDLPSVMTCANYLKLPSYSSKEIMYKQILYAISEGQGSFDLS
uniref:E3 ubiquitin-protein ligase UPL3-like n=1 Tax=Erigeron canadensis TaxID=72917 RepID=UPI001CB8992F|nr:E3 ubiquitin-protein ligase UPL3-like [Erigeron canadensis]